MGGLVIGSAVGGVIGLRVGGAVIGSGVGGGIGPGVGAGVGIWWQRQGGHPSRVHMYVGRAKYIEAAMCFERRNMCDGFVAWLKSVAVQVQHFHGIVSPSPLLPFCVKVPTNKRCLFTCGMSYVLIPVKYVEVAQGSCGWRHKGRHKEEHGCRGGGVNLLYID